MALLYGYFGQLARLENFHQFALCIRTIRRGLRWRRARVRTTHRSEIMTKFRAK